MANLKKKGVLAKKAVANAAAVGPYSRRANHHSAGSRRQNEKNAGSRQASRLQAPNWWTTQTSKLCSTWLLVVSYLLTTVPNVWDVKSTVMLSSNRKGRSKEYRGAATPTAVTTTARTTSERALRPPVAGATLAERA